MKWESPFGGGIKKRTMRHPRFLSSLEIIEYNLLNVRYW